MVLAGQRFPNRKGKCVVQGKGGGALQRSGPKVEAVEPFPMALAERPGSWDQRSPRQPQKPEIPAVQSKAAAPVAWMAAYSFPCFDCRERWKCRRWGRRWTPSRERLRRPARAGRGSSSAL